MILETIKRSFLKSISYRLFGTSLTILITFAISRKLEMSVAVGTLDLVLKILFYFFHERIWQHIPFGLRSSRGAVFWLTGLSASGKSTLAKKMVEFLQKKHFPVVWLDGDHVRKHFPSLGFTKDERNDHIKRVALSASLLEKQGNIVLVSLISPYLESRNFAREQCENFYEIFLNASVEDCKKRDVKGLYQKALDGEIKNFTGISDDYQVPLKPDLVLNTGQEPEETSIKTLQKFIKKRTKL